MFSIFLIVGFAVFVGMALAVFATRQKIPGVVTLVPPEDDAAKDAETAALAPEQLYKLAEHLCRENKLQIKEKMENSERESYWIAESQNEFFFGTYVIGFFRVAPDEPFVTMAEILEFKDFIKSMGSSKGFCLTNGYFTRDVHQPLEGPKVTLYNKRKVLEELKKHSLS